MTNSTEFWRQVDSRIDEKLSKFLQPTGVTPGVYGSVTVDRYGLVRFGAAGGGAGPLCWIDRSNAQSIPDSTDTDIVWNSEEDDDGGMHDSGTNPERVTLPSDGIYLAIATVEWPSNIDGRRWVSIIQAGGSGPGLPTIGASYVAPATTSTTLQQAVGMLTATAGTYLVVRVYQTSGSAKNTQSGTQFQVIKLG